MSNKSRFSLAARTVALSIAFSLASLPVIGGSYTVSVPSGSYMPLAWSFQDSTVGTAFPSPADGTQVEIYNPMTGAYSIAEYDSGSGGWDHPSYSLINGTGFYYFNNTSNALNITVSGSDLTSSSKTFNYSSNTWYFLGYAFLQPTNSTDAIECIYDSTSMTYYTTDSLGYHSNIGDVVLSVWNRDIGELVSADRANCSSRYSPFWEDTSNPCSEFAGTGLGPQLFTGLGFWLKPAVNTSWTHYKALPSCQ